MARVYVDIDDLERCLGPALPEIEPEQLEAAQRLCEAIARGRAREAAKEALKKKKAEEPRRMMTFRFLSNDSMNVMKAMAEATGLGVPNVRFSINRTVTAEESFFLDELPAIAKKHNVKLVLEVPPYA